MSAHESLNQLLGVAPSVLILGTPAVSVLAFLANELGRALSRPPLHCRGALAAARSLQPSARLIAFPGPRRAGERA